MGLSLTAVADINQARCFPAFPHIFLQSSALGGSLIEFVLGKGVLGQGVENTVLQLHPFAISGFSGLLGNALALLPLGHTDGGRIALAMFGRPGANLLKYFTTLLLYLWSLVGLNSLLMIFPYIAFVVLWQYDPEAPARNEVEQLDFPRASLGISMALIMALVLLPLY
jgi:membrane-associated protease RseP (regulator of RpoE activity)